MWTDSLEGLAVVDTDSVLALLQETADAVIVPRFRALAGADVMEKAPGDLVTVADREAEVIIARRLREAYPDALVVGEEATSADPGLLDRIVDADHVFTVDPVDGTKNFVEGKADHAVMCAEIRASQIVRSWIWQPAHRVAYVAERGAGAWRDGERLSRPEPAGEPGELHGATSTPELAGRAIDGLAPLGRSWACCGVDYPRLAEGVVDFIVYKHSWPWDHAPGMLLLSEVGGAGGWLDGEPYAITRRDAWLVPAASPGTYATVRARLAELSA